MDADACPSAWFATRVRPITNTRPQRLPRPLRAHAVLRRRELRPGPPAASRSLLNGRAAVRISAERPDRRPLPAASPRGLCYYPVRRETPGCRREGAAQRLEVSCARRVCFFNDAIRVHEAPNARPQANAQPEPEDCGKMKARSEDSTGSL